MNWTRLNYKKALGLLFTISIIIGSFSCSKDLSDDKEKPVIEDIRTLDSEGNDAYEFAVGDDITFQIKFTDDVELANYRMEVHFAGEGHYHYYDVDSKYQISESKWEFEQSGVLKGTSQTVEHTFTIDETLAKASPYHIIVYAVDAIGNTADFKIVSFFVTKENMPVITLTQPSTEEIEVKIGETITIEGKVRAEAGLSKIKFFARRIDSPNQEIILNKDVTYSAAEKEVVFTQDLTVPAGSEEAVYIGYILASDKSGSVGEKYFLITSVN